MKHILVTILLIKLILSATAGDTIKLFSWNIFMVPPVVFKSCQTERAVLIADYVLEIDPDIVVLQEAFMKETRMQIETRLSGTYPFQADLTKSGVLKANSGIWMLSKYPILQQDFIVYTSKKGSDRFSKKGATFARFDIQGKKMQLICTHTQSSSKHHAVRARQFTQLKTTLADRYFDEQIPQFIAGDLNVNYFDSVFYQQMISILKVLPADFPAARYSYDGKTNDLAATFFKSDQQQTLDYILLRKEHQSAAEIVSTDILKPTRDSCFCKKSFYDLSDHHPVISTIRLK
jgi:endonuclease/exonuclease/phosphatase family metal-dependent hydrolase